MERLRKDRRVLFAAAAVVFFLFLFLMLLDLNMRKELSHDEHVFVAGGALASHSLIPYRDYGYNHMPYLAFIYAAVFRFTDYLLLTGRGMSTVCELAALGLVFFVTSNLFSERRDVLRFLIAAGAVLLLLTNPLFAYTSGYAWNHALPVLAALVAFMAQHYGVRQEGGAKWVFLSGMLLGLATGIRVSFAMAIPPVAAVILLSSHVTAPRARVRLVLWFAAGLALAILPALIMLALYPSRFIFDVIDFNQIGSRLWSERGVFRALTPHAKLTYFATEILRDPGNLALGCLFVACVLSLRAPDVRARMGRTFEASTAMMVALFLLVGAFLSTPPWPQYFYAPVPFLVLGIVYAMASMGTQATRGTWVLGLFALAILVSSVHGLPEYSHVRGLLSRSLGGWVPIETHLLGTEIRREVGRGRVLTLAPVYPLEGGAKIYCEFSEGPFFWRAGHLLTETERSKLGVVSPAELDALLKEHAPEAVLVGFEAAYGWEELETPFVNYAKAHRYRVLRLSNGADLWLSPSIRVTNLENGTSRRANADRLHPCI